MSEKAAASSVTAPGGKEGALGSQQGTGEGLYVPVQGAAVGQLLGLTPAEADKGALLDPGQLGVLFPKQDYLKCLPSAQRTSENNSLTN